MSEERKTERMGKLDPTSPIPGVPLPPARAPGRPERKVSETQPIGVPVTGEPPAT